MNMIGNYGENTRTLRQRDAEEFVTMEMLKHTWADLKAKGVTISSVKMREVRDAWRKTDVRGNDFGPMNFTHVSASPFNIKELLLSTGATDFGILGNVNSDPKVLENNIKTEFFKRVAEYDENAKEGRYLHVITDPELRDSIPSLETSIKLSTFAHMGKSARELNVGDAVQFHNRKSGELAFESVVSEGTYGQMPREGFNQTNAPIQTETRVQNQTATQTASTTPPVATAEDFGNDEQLMGWNGGTDADGREYRGLSHIMEAYLTSADATMVAKNFDDTAMFDAVLAHNTVDLLKHLRSNGRDFSVYETEYRNQIELRMNVGERVSVRAFDATEGGTHMGRVYDGLNTYRYNVLGSPRDRAKVKFNAADAIALVDYVTGHKKGKVQKSHGTETSRVKLEGVQGLKSVQISPHTNAYRSFVFADEAEATDYIKTGIADATLLVNEEFKLEEIQALIDEGLDSDDILVSSPEFLEGFEALYSNDIVIREAQERAVMLMIHSENEGLERLTAARDAIVGNFEDGFNPAFVIDHMQHTGRGNERNAMMSALKFANYDIDKIKGNEFAVNAIRENIIAYNPETARSIDEVDHPMLKQAMQTVHDTLVAGGFRGESKAPNSKPDVKIDENGIIRWEANRETGSRAADNQWQSVSGEIGQVMVTNEDGIIMTQFQGDNNYGIVPGYTGYFSFEGDYDDRMSRFRAKGFEQHLLEQVQAQTTHQMTRPLDKTLKNIPTTLDASSLNGLYHGDVYGKRIEPDFMETSQLNQETKLAIIKTLSNRVRFDNQFSDYATTSAETQANREYNNQQENEAAFSYWKVAGETNMRVLEKDLENYADTTMTGTGKTQGLIWFLTDGSQVNPDGSVTPSKGIPLENGEYAPDVTALQKLPYFDKKDFNAWDRNQMSASQLMVALRVDENVNTALMAFGGWTFDDSYAVSKEFAERNQVFGEKPNEHSRNVLNGLIEEIQAQGSGSDGYDNIDFTSIEKTMSEENMRWSKNVLIQGAKLKEEAFDLATDQHYNGSQYDVESMLSSSNSADKLIEDFLDEHGRFRLLQRGDKLSDFGGNKGTVGIVIDREMSGAEAKRLKLSKEVRFMKANPTLDVISAPYSMLSRHNAGVVKELMDGEVQDLTDPDTGEVYKAAMGKLDIIVTDMVVDDKTHAYSREDVLDGKGRKASGQLAWALQSKGASGILNEIYGRNDSAWSTYREYLIATGLDMKADGTIMSEYTPHADEKRHAFAYDPNVESHEFLENIKDQGGFLDMPFDVQFKTGAIVQEIPVLSASLRQNVELVDGSMRRSDFTNYYMNIYEHVGEYHRAENDAARKEAQSKAQDQFDKIQSTIIDRQFEGGHNGKNSYIRDKIMGKRMAHSATGVAIVDPRLDIGQAGMNQEMMDALGAKEGDVVMAFRDPVWRDGAIRAMTVTKDDSVHGIAFNPITDKSHDGDFDGDTFGIIKFDTPEATKDLVNKFSHWANMIDKGNGFDELYFQTGMDLASAEAKAERLGDSSVKELYEKAETLAKSTDPRILKQAEKALNKYSHKCFREHGFGGDYVSLESDEASFESFAQMVKHKAKGNEAGLEAYKGYHNGERTDADAREVQYATGVKSDDTGLAGAFSQKLVSVMRNHDIQGALESMYPVSQGTLQIKKDAKKARVVNKILTDDLNKTFEGRNRKNSKQKLTPKQFKDQLTEIFEEDLGVDVAEEHIDAVTEVLTHKGQIVPLKEAVALKGSPMDRVAYGGGFEELKKLAKNGSSLLEGEQSKLFSPFTMRNATEETKLVKRDTQRAIEEEVADVTVTVEQAKAKKEAAPEQRVPEEVHRDREEQVEMSL